MCLSKAKGKCDNYDHGGPESSNSPFRFPSPSVAPSPVARPASPMTEGKYIQYIIMPKKLPIKHITLITAKICASFILK